MNVDDNFEFPSNPTVKDVIHRSKSPSLGILENVTDLTKKMIDFYLYSSSSLSKMFDFVKENGEMAEKKYEKYFVSGLKPGEKDIMACTLAHLEESRMPGSNYYFAHVVPTSIEGAIHGPHIHKDAELMMHFGLDPDDPFDLGAEVEFCMGSEMEVHTFTRTTTVFIPPNMVHCPWTLKKVNRPFLLIQIHQGPTHTEKSYRQLLPKELRDKMMFIDEGFGGEREIYPPKGMEESKPNPQD